MCVSTRVCAHVYTCYLSVCLCVCFCFVLQAWHHFLSSRPKVAKQLHFCRLSEKMLLRWVVHKPNSLLCSVKNVMSLEDAGFVCMIAHAFIWTAVHLCLQTLCRKSWGRQREESGVWKCVCWIHMIPRTNKKNESVMLLHGRIPPVVCLKYSKISFISYYACGKTYWCL